MEEGATATLQLIDKYLDSLELPMVAYEKLASDYAKDPAYRSIIGILSEDIQKHVDLDKIDFVSGGIRRDLFYSILIARALEKPLLTILKDQRVILSEPNGSQAHIVSEFKTTENVLHVADIFTEASSHRKITL
jgi:adenine/guanine phosphoribosyltransferase-like PRPP-binding protein